MRAVTSSVSPSTLPTSRNGAARAVSDDSGGDAGPLTAIALIDVLDDLFAALMLKIDIDIGRLLALRGDEAGKQKVMLGRVNSGDAKHVADGGVGRRPTPLAQNAPVLATRTISWMVRK
jgi:hypothetical protein